ncbi:MAG: hypothetical protein JO284_13670 [Planctomycetaceae bacterium]|nr:hypothetical protein [Planctomycetaceae bacterium]MBV8317759.1 hypothetical protein [Planctomycetaceae bacterium]
MAESSCRGGRRARLKGRGGANAPPIHPVRVGAVAASDARSLAIGLEVVGPPTPGEASTGPLRQGRRS